MGFLKDLVVRIKGDKTQLDSTLKGASSSVSVFSGIVTKLGSTLAAAFGVGAIINFTKEAMKLAATAEGIKKGFEQIASPKLLQELRKATGGTVSDMQLMSRAVQASNFQIPLENLGKLLEFASARAIQTGQSVDYLVDSIVLGIGRKSPLILDNLGISAVRLRQLLKGPGVEMATVGDIAKAVGDIATEELAKMGGMAETAGSKFQSLTASVSNLKVAWGEFINNSGLAKKTVSDLAATLDNMTIKAQMRKDNRLSFLEKMYWTPEQYKAFLKQEEYIDKRIAGMATKDINPKTGKPYLSINDWQPEQKEITTISSLNKVLEDEKKALEAIDVEDKKAIQNQLTTIALLEKRIKKLQELPNAEAPKAEVGFLRAGKFGKNKLAGGPAGGNQMIADVMGFLWQREIDSSEAMRSLEDFQARMQEALSSMRDMAVDYGMQIAEALGEALGGGNVQELGKGLLLSLANFLSQFGKMLIVAGLGIDAFAKSMATGNAPLAIAAGAAMLVAAGAIKGLMASAGKSGVSGAGGYSGAGGGMQTIRVEGVLKGKDIHWSNKRYEEEN